MASIIVRCGLCGKKITATDDTKMTIQDLVEKHKIPEMLIRIGHTVRTQYICDECTSYLTTPPLCRLTKDVKPFGTGGGIYLPKKWVGKKVSVILEENQNEIR